MDEILKMLDEKLEYISHEIVLDTIYINAVSNLVGVECPKCKKVSFRVHAYYEKTFQDLPIQGKKVKIILRNRKMLCMSKDCETKTFAETFDFIKPKAKKTNRLEEEIINISINTSSIAASKVLKKNIADVSKSTICNILKKI